MTPILDIQNLVVGLGSDPNAKRIIDGISLQVHESETLCVVGESGSGKSVTSLTVMGLLQKGALTPSAGSVKLVGEELLGASDRRLRQLRATTMAMIFQEPMTALNPVVPVGRQIDEVLRVHTDLDARARRQKILAMMEQVRLPEVERIFASYPHRLSGGQRQRIMIAMALVLEPKLLIADEPTTALDVTTQKQILTLIRDLQRDHGTAVLFITHDMGVVAEIADRVAVMRNGRLVETGTLDTILRQPTMEYTRKLLSAVPSLVPRAPRKESTEPVVLEANDLCKIYRERSFFGKVREVAAAKDVTLTLRKGRTLGIVGESGSGKSTVARCIVRLIDPDIGRRAAGRPRNLRPVATAAATAPQAYPDHLSGPVSVAQPARLRRREHRGRPDQLRHAAQPGAGEGPRTARAGRPAARRYLALPAPVLRRPAPAHRDRARARARPRCAGRG